MATVATAEVQIIADTSRFVADLRRKLRAALTPIGNQLGDQLVRQIDRRFGARLNTVLTQAGRRAARSFTDAMTDGLNRSGIPQNLRDALGGTASRRGAQQAGEAVADSFADGLRGGDQRISDTLMDAISNQTLFRIAGRSGADTAQIFEDNFRQNLGNTVSDRIAQQFHDAAENARNQIPPLFRGSGEQAASAFVDGMEENLRRDLNQALFEALAANPDIDSDAFFAGQRSGIQYSNGLVGSLQNRLAQQMQQAFQNAQQTGIPPIFRRLGNTSGLTFANAVADEVDDSLTAALGRLFLRIGNRSAANAGGRAGTSFGGAFTKALRSLPGVFQRLLNAIVVGPLRGLGGIFAQMSSEMLSMAGQALAVVALLEALSGLLYGLPAATALAGAAIAAIIVPLRGVGEAFSAAGDDAEEFEEALKGLTPEAQAVAREFRAIAPALTELRLRAQAAFFGELQGAITDVADNLLGPLSDGLASAAGGFGRIVDQFAEFLAQSETADTVRATFEALTGIFDALAESTQPFLEGMRTLIDEFLPEIEDFQGPLSRIGKEFRDWAKEVTESGEAMEAFDRGRDTLEEIFRIVRDVSEIFDAMFDAAESVGVDALGAVADAVADIRAEFESLDGQELLGQLFDSLGRIADSASDVFGTLFTEIAELTPEIADLFEEVSPHVQDLIEGLSEGIQELLDSGGTEFFKELAEALSDIDWKTIGQRLGELLGNIGPVIDDLETALNVVLAIIDFAIDLGEFLNDLFSGTESSSWTQAIQDFFDDLLNLDEAQEWIDDMDRRIAKFFREGLPALLELSLDFIAGLFVRWYLDIKEGWDDFWEGIDAATDLALQAIREKLAEWFLGNRTDWDEFWSGLNFSALSSLGILVPGVGTQLGLLSNIQAEWGTVFQIGWQGIWDGIVAYALQATLNVTTGVQSGLNNITETVSGWATSTSAVWSIFWTTMTTTASSKIRGFSSFVSLSLQTIRSNISSWASGVRALWSTLWTSLSSSASSKFRGISAAVSIALDKLRSIFSGFAAAVRITWNSLLGTLQDIASSISSVVSRISGAISSAISAAQTLGGLDLNPFANGGIVYGPTPALVGEAGPEVIIPLTRPQRAVDLVQQSGLLGLLASQGVLGAPQTTSTTATNPVEMHVHSGVADPEQIARRAVRIIERRLGGRGLERVAP